VAPSRLMVLINQALRWQRHQGLLPLGQEFDLFKGEMLQLQTEDEAPPSFESAKIKVSSPFSLPFMLIFISIMVADVFGVIFG
jgi:hypothetical protein